MHSALDREDLAPSSVQSPALRGPCSSQTSCTATTHHSFQGSFSAGSTPIFASKYAFCSIFRDLQEYHLLASKFCKLLQKLLQNFGQNLQTFSEFFKIFKILPKFAKICSREDAFLVDLEKCCKMRLWLQKSASIQPRTSPGKSDVSWLCSWLRLH